MKPTKATASIVALIASGSLGVDAMVFDGKVVDPRVEMIASEQVELKQVENVVEAKAPWKGEQGLTIKYDMGEATIEERVRDRRSKEVIYETVDFGDGGFKVDVLLTEKPSTNRFCYTIEGAENYDFFYQPPLTAEEIAEGASRPPEIEGSYAVYHKTLKNHVIGKENYATGKVMHIPRPQVWELGNEEATKRWADISYENGQLCVTAPQDFIDNADYTNGVRIDPTFGYTTVPGSVNSAGSAEELEASHFTLSDIGVDVTKITAYTSNPSGGNIKTVIYDDSAGQPQDRVAVSDAVAAPGSIGWTDFTTSVSIPASGEYWLGVIANTSNRAFGYDSGPSNSAYWFVSAGAYTTPPATWTDFSNSRTRLNGVYATYNLSEVPSVDSNTIRLNNGTIRINNGTIDI